MKGITMSLKTMKNELTASLKALDTEIANYEFESLLKNTVSMRKFREYNDKKAVAKQIREELNEINAKLATKSTLWNIFN